MDRGLEIVRERRESLEKLIEEWKADPRKGWSREADIFHWFDPHAVESACRCVNRPSGALSRFYTTIPKSKMISPVYGKLYVCDTCQRQLECRKRSWVLWEQFPKAR